MGIKITSNDAGMIAADLRAAGTGAGPLVSIAVRKTAADVERDAKTLAPVDTGNLRMSISTDTIESDASIAAEVGPTANYGGFLETGTSKMGPQPYMTPALERNAPMLEAALGQIVDRLLP